MARTTASKSITSRRGILALVVIVIGAFAWILTENSGENRPAPQADDLSTMVVPQNPTHGDRPRAIPLTDFALSELDESEQASTFERHAAITNRGTIRGRVTAAKWVPWRVVLKQDGKGELDFVVSQTKPTFRFDSLEIGSYELRLAADGYRPMVQTIRVRENKLEGFFALPLLTDNQIEGIVRDLHGLLVPGMLVTAVPVTDDPSVRLTGHPARTDDEGHFIMKGLRPGTWRVYPGERRNPLGEGQVIELSEGMREAWVNIEVPRFGSATVTLVSSDGRELPKGLRVMAMRDSRKSGPLPDSLQNSKSHTATSANDDQGVAHFSHLPPGQYTFTAFGAKYRRTIQRGAVREGEISEVVIEMRAYGREMPPR